MIDHVDGWHRSIWHLGTDGEYEKVPFMPKPPDVLPSIWAEPVMQTPIPEPARNPLLLEYRRTTGVTP